MRKYLAFTAFAVAVAAFAHQGGTSLFGTFTKSLNAANSVSSTFTVARVGGGSESISVDLKKPNMARIDRANEMIIADGKNIITFNKESRKFYKKPQTDADLMGMFASDDLSGWTPFFDANALKATGVKMLGPKTRKGVTLNGVETTQGKKLVTYFLGQTDNLPRQAQIDVMDANGKTTTVLNTSSLTVGSTDASVFKFAAPSDASEVNYAEMTAGRWLTNLDEAKKLAKDTNRLIFVDFMATWCGPCKKLDAEVLTQDKFKKLAGKIVFLRIDVDAQKNVASAYKIEAMPTQMVLSADGSVLATTVGYGQASDFFAWLLPAIGGK